MARATADASVFHAIADPTRRRILELLRDGEWSAGDLYARMAEPKRRARLSQPAFSQHLGVLRRAGLVEQRKSGRHRLYAVRAEPLHEVSLWIAHFDRFWSEKLDKLGQYLDRQRDSKELMR